MKWPKVKIHELCTRVSSGGTPTSTNHAYYDGGKIPWLNTGEVDFTRIYETARSITQKGVDNSAAHLIPANSVVVAMYGNTAGKAAIAKIPLTTNQACCNLEIDVNKANYEYVYYQLCENYLRLKSLSIGAAQRNLNSETIKEFEIALPPLPEQRAIAGVLSALDDKIEMNRKICKELEETAKLIYDYWFVQFDFPDARGRPYRSSGGKMVYSPVLKRKIPEGWEVDNIYRIADYINGLACQRFRPGPGALSLPVIKIREMHEGVSAETERVAVDIPAQHKIQDGDLLFSWSATLEIQQWVGGDGGLNQHIFKVVPKAPFPKSFVLMVLQEYMAKFVAIAASRKTTMGHITSAHMTQSRIVIPPLKILQAFDSVVAGLLATNVQKRQESRELSSLRDWLLPLLLSGQVAVKKKNM